MLEKTKMSVKVHLRKNSTIDKSTTLFIYDFHGSVGDMIIYLLSIRDVVNIQSNYQKFTTFLST